MIDLEKSKEIAEKIEALPQHCYINAFNAMSELPPEAMYIEGWTLFKDGLITDHAWIVLDGAIIDPTYYETIPANYYPGIRFTKAEIVAAASENKLELPVAYSLMSLDMDKYKGYKQAYDQVIADCRKILNQRD